MKIHKAILTGGGRATRLRPITNTINKHLIPLAGKPMIFHAIAKAVEAGITEIFININPEEIQLQQAVGDGGHWGIKIKFFVQAGGPQGIAHVVKCAEEFIGNDPFMFYLSDNIILGSLAPFFEEFNQKNADALFAFAQVPDPERFGVPVFNERRELVDVIEKPKIPPSRLAQTGIYLYGPKLFFEAFKNIQPSARGEYEISSINSYLLKNGFRVAHREITGWWKDTGQPEDLLYANALLLKELPPSERQQIGAGTTVGAGVRIEAPVIIGANCTLENCSIGPNVTVGQGSTIKNCVIQNSIILGNCTITAPLKITDSIIGERATVEKASPGAATLILGDHTWLQI